MVLTVNSNYLLNVNQSIFVMVKCGVLFEVRTEFLNIFTRASSSKGGNERFFKFDVW
jgi:hypothetical protein